MDHKNCESQFRRYLYEYATHERVIFDRSHISEVVYGEILRDKSSFSAKELKILNSIVDLEFIFVLAEAKYGKFRSRMKNGKRKEVIKTEDYEKITTKFRKSLKGIEYFLYKSESKEELESMTERIIKKIEKGGF